MRIGFDVSHIQVHRAGIGRYSADLLRALIAAQGDSEIVLHGWSYSLDLRFLESFAGSNVTLRVLRLPGIAKRWYWDTCRRPTVNRFTGPLAVFQSSDPFLPPLGGIKGVCIVHDCCQRRHPQFFRKGIHRREKALERSLERAEAIIVPSEHTREDVMELYSVAPQKIRVMHPPLSSRFHKQTADDASPDALAVNRVAGGRPFMLFVGTLEPRKNIVRLIRAYEIAASVMEEEIGLIIVGKPGWMCQDVFRALRESPVRDRVKYVGYLSDAQTSSLYRMARVFVYPSIFEGFGYPVLEAMASGTPVITSNTSSLAEIAGGAAELVDPLDVDGLAHAMVFVAADDARRRDLSAAGLVRAASLGASGAGSMLMGLYSSLAAN